MQMVTDLLGYSLGRPHIGYQASCLALTSGCCWARCLMRRCYVCKAVHWLNKGVIKGGGTHSRRTMKKARKTHSLQ